MSVEENMTGTLRKESRGHEPVIAFTQNQAGDVLTGNVMHNIGTNSNATGRNAANVMVDSETDTLYIEGIKQGDTNASTYEADASSILSTLRKEVGEAQTTEWGFRVLDCLQQEEILRLWLHGESLRCASEPFRHWVLSSAPSFKEGSAGECLRHVWENGPDGCTPQGRGLAKQLCVQLGDYLQKLSQSETSQDCPVQGLRITSEGIRLLRQTLSEIQKVRRSSDVQAQPAHARYYVRRLTVKECERLQGFPDGHTAITIKGKPAADGPRYKAIGNSMAVNVMSWIGQRIQMVDEIVNKENV